MKVGTATKAGCFLISRTRCSILLCHNLLEVRPGNTKQKGQERILRGRVPVWTARLDCHGWQIHYFLCERVVHKCNKSLVNPVTRGRVWTLVLSLWNKRKVRRIPHGLKGRGQQSGRRWGHICWQCFLLTCLRDFPTVTLSPMHSPSKCTNMSWKRWVICAQVEAGEAQSGAQPTGVQRNRTRTYRWSSP